MGNGEFWFDLVIVNEIQVQLQLQLLTTDQPLTNHVQTPYQAPTDTLPTTYCSPYQPLTDILLYGAV